MAHHRPEATAGGADPDPEDADAADQNRGRSERSIPARPSRKIRR